MGTQGCVSFMFTKKGVLVIEREDLDKDEDTVMSDALEYGASDFEADEDVFTIYTEPEDFSAVRDDLEKAGYTFVSAELEMVPSTYTKIDDEDNKTKMQKMLDMFEDNDDIQNVWHNWEMEDSFIFPVLSKLNPYYQQSRRGYNRRLFCMLQKSLSHLSMFS